MAAVKGIKKYLPDWFISAIVIMILLAWLAPGVGREGSMLELKTIIRYGIMLLFFFYGLRLNPRQLIVDLSNWKIHLVIQLITFVFFPIFVLLFFPIFKSETYYTLWLAVFFLAALPSTVSSSVVMVSMARGNVTGAIFNASISGIIGILITPLWMGLFLSSSTQDFDLSQTFIDLTLQILLPLIAGLLLYRFWGQWMQSKRKYLGIFDKSVILLIIYNSFSNSFLDGVFLSIPKWTLILLAIVVIALFFVMYYWALFISRKVGFKRDEEITVLICGSNKSLVHGSVMASVLFAGSTLGSLFLVPIMIYHAFQLFYLSIVTRRMGREPR